MSSKLSTKVAIPPGVSEKLYRTKMCNYFKRGEECKYRDKCFFAHGEKEMRPLVLQFFAFIFNSVYSPKVSFQIILTKKMMRERTTLMIRRKLTRKTSWSKISQRSKTSWKRCKPRKSNKNSFTLTKWQRSRRKIKLSKIRSRDSMRKGCD